MTDELNHDESPQLNEDLQGKSIDFASVEAACNQADSDADDRDDLEVSWSDVIETPVHALTVASFESHVGETFVVDLGHHLDEIELVEVTKRGEAVDAGNGISIRAPFELVFKDLTERTRLPEGIYRLKHDGVGEVEVYLTPEGANHNRLIAAFC